MSVTTLPKLKTHTTAKSGFGPMALLSLAALGVVFGDIGTSPLYAFKLCFAGEYPAAATPANILGILSLIFWALVIVVCVKYVGYMLRADNEGQGGTIALLALLSPRRRGAMPLALTGLAVTVLIGECMLYGDGAITPAISVISALEGLDVWTKAAHPFIVPISIAILIGLFMSQKHGTDFIGKFFGPIMLLWFGVIGLLGAIGISHHPAILSAINPFYAITFFIHNGLRSLLIFGAVVLCITGVEALYSDLAHFGRLPITYAWYIAVFPALVLNYLGQGAIAISRGNMPDSTFFALVPSWAIIPMVTLATLATIIASQALISGVFSLTQQLMQLGFAPRFRIIHTSQHHSGQIYIPTINAMLAVVCVVLVLAFRSSDAFGGAYGLAVTVTMVISSIAFLFLLLRKWQWKPWQAFALVGLFLSLDLSFLIGNLSKVLSGGWVPLAMAGTLFTIFATWNRGRRKMLTRLNTRTLSVQEFSSELRDPIAGSGTGIFFAPNPEGIPFAAKHQWMRDHIAYDTIILLTIVHGSTPYVPVSQRLEIEQLCTRMYRVRACYGFMQEAKIDDILAHLGSRRPEIDLSHPTYYLADPKIVDDRTPEALPVWQRALFRWLNRNARPITDSLGLPADSIVEFGVEVAL